MIGVKNYKKNHKFKNMPYTHKKIGDKECVYKKDTGAKVGCTKGDVNKYLAALHANANESVTETNTIKGGKADKMSVEDIAKKFKVSVGKIQAQIQKGIEIEKEHTSDKEKATEIAMDHVTEFPDYYDRLIKMEKKAEKEIQTESTKDLIKRLLRENMNDRAEFLTWKRRNVTLRGIANAGNENNAGAAFGQGLYTAFLGNKEMARKYGDVYFVVGAIPKKPKVFNGTNEAEIFLQNLVTIFCKEHNIERSNSYFSNNTSISEEMLKRGYDGLVVKGREMVNYSPPDNVKYFKTEDQLYRYYKTL